MAVMTERPSWSDERLDDLSKRMDEGFHRNDVEHQEFRREMKAGFDLMNAGFNARFDKLQQTLIVIGAGLIGTLIAAVIAGVVAIVIAV
jgi:hypothetical protein